MYTTNAGSSFGTASYYENVTTTTCTIKAYDDIDGNPSMVAGNSYGPIYVVTYNGSSDVDASVIASDPVYLNGKEEEAYITAYNLAGYADSIPTLEATYEDANKNSILLTWGNADSDDLVSVDIYLNGTYFNSYLAGSLPGGVGFVNDEITSVTYTATFKPTAYSDNENVASVTTELQTVTINEYSSGD